MPGLYSRLVEARKGAVDPLPTATDTPSSYKSLASFSNREGVSTSQPARREEKQISIFVTGKD
jgi:hypothetical protein